MSSGGRTLSSSLEQPGQLEKKGIALRRLLPQTGGAALVGDLEGAEGGEDAPDGEELDALLVDGGVGLGEELGVEVVGEVVAGAEDVDPGRAPLEVGLEVRVAQVEVEVGAVPGGASRAVGR